MLLKAAEHPHGFVHDIEIEGYSPEVVGYHAHLLGQAGLANVFDVTTIDKRTPHAQIKSLTWAGHDYVDAIRDEGVWKKTKSATKAAGGYTFEIVKQVAIAVLKDAIAKGGLPLSPQ